MFIDLPHLENLKIQVPLKSCPSAHVWFYIIVAVEAAYLDKLLLWCTFLNMLQAFRILAQSSPFCGLLLYHPYSCLDIHIWIVWVLTIVIVHLELIWLILALFGIAIFFCHAQWTNYLGSRERRYNLQFSLVNGITTLLYWSLIMPNFRNFSLVLSKLKYVGVKSVRKKYEKCT